MPSQIQQKLSENQKKAAESQAQSLVVLAGPGTGKTRVIIARILNLLDSGVAPERILAVTFSKKATFEMEERLLQERPELSDRLNISTLHAFCVELVQKHGFRLGLGRKLELMSETQAQLLFRRLAPQLPFQYFVKSSAIDSVIGDLLDFFQDCKDEGLWPEQVMSYAQRLPETTEDERSIKQEWIALGDIYNSFQSYCFEEGLLDFGDAVLGALRLLEDNPIVRKEVQAEFEHLLVDEFQDTNWTQIQLLRHLCGPNSNICVVGDDDQAIYRFRGASYAAFQFFQDLFPEPEVVELNETYRLPPAVAAAATALIRQNGERRFRPEKEIRSMTNYSEAVQLIESPDYEEEAQWVADKIQKLIQEGCSPSKIGILVRAHSHAELLHQELLRRGLPVEGSNSQSLFGSETVRDAFALFRVVVTPDDSISLLRLLDSSFVRLDQKSIFEFCRWAKFGRRPYYECLLQIDESPLAATAKESLKKLSDLLQLAQSSSARKSASEILLQFCEETGAVRHLLSLKRISELEQLAQFLQKLVEWERIQKEKSLQRIFPLLEALSEQSLILSDEEAANKDSGAIRILSVHASKGLEFENVFVLSLVGRRFPGNFRSNTWLLPNEIRKESAPTKETHLDEERRLLYVAMTRAQKNLYLSTILKKGTRPSVFLSNDIEKNIEPKYLQKVVVPKMEIEKLLSTSLQKIFSRESGPTPKKTGDESTGSLRLSFTQLEKYERCPLSYWFAYELGIPSVPTSSLLTGSSVHEALEEFYRKVQQGQTPSAEELESYFVKSFEHNKANYGVLSETDLQLGKTKLGEFYLAQEGNFEAPLAIEKDFKLSIGSHTLRGKIDRVDKLKDGVRILDYKTGKSKSAEKKEDQKYAKESLQFSIYALAAKECFNWEVKELCFYYVYDNQVLTTERTDEDLKQTKEKIQSIAEQIQKKEFEAKPGFICKFCEFQKLCPQAMV